MGTTVAELAWGLYCSAFIIFFVRLNPTAAILLQIWSKICAAVFFPCGLKNHFLTCQRWQLFIVQPNVGFHYKCLQFFWTAQHLLKLLEWQFLSGECIFAVSNLRYAFRSVDYYCQFSVFLQPCFKWKCIFPVFQEQVFFLLLFFLYLDFYPIVDVTDSCSCFIRMLMMSESKLTAHPGASPCLAAHVLLPSHIFKVFSALSFIPPSCSVASVIISLGSSFKNKNIKITLANQCSSSVVLLILLFPP